MKKIIPLFVLCLILGCEKDDTNVNTLESNDDHSIQFEYVSKEAYQDKPEVNKVIKRFSLHKSQYLKNSIGKERYDNALAKNTYLPEYDVTVNEDYVAHIQAGDYESFTYQIVNTYIDDELHNLFLSKRSDGSYDSFIIKYPLTEHQKTQIENGIKPDNFDHNTFELISAGNTMNSQNSASGTDLCVDYPCEGMWNGTYYYVFRPNVCATRTWNQDDDGGWGYVYVETACPPEFTATDSGGGGSGGGSGDGTSTTGPGTNTGGTGTGGDQTDNCPNCPDENDPVNGGTTSNDGSTTNQDDDTSNNADDNEDDTCIPFGEAINGFYSCDATTPVVCVEDECVDDEDCNTSKEDLKKVFPNMPDNNADLLASIINEKGLDFGIESDEDLWHFLSQAGHETGGFNTLNVTESTYYTTASLLPTRYTRFTMDPIIASNDPNKYYAPDYTQNSEGVANVAMCCNYGNGNVESGDGYKYRGRGIFQLTWEDNYSDFKTWYNELYDPDIDPVTSPEIIADNDTLAILSGLWYYKTRVVDAIEINQSTPVSKVTYPINSGLTGLDDRRQKFNKAKDSINCL